MRATANTALGHDLATLLTCTGKRFLHRPHQRAGAQRLLALSRPKEIPQCSRATPALAMWRSADIN